MQHDQLSQEMLQRVSWVRERLLCWFEYHGRSFPWREPGRSPYELAVAEILLQRTTAAGVARAFPGLIALYPSWQSMAEASLEELQEGLRPLGLWRQRARALLDLSTIVVKGDGHLPCSRRDLETLPGIGPYTASALLVAVFGLHEPLLDVNMARVLARFFGLGVRTPNVRDACLHSLALHLVRGERWLSLNWSVLDLGALVCRARNPLCQQCPLRQQCQELSSASTFSDGSNGSFHAL